MQSCFKTNQRVVRRVFNLLNERIKSIVVFKIDVLFCIVKGGNTNKSVSELLESLPLKTFLSILRMLLKKNDLSSEKNLGMNSSFNVFAIVRNWI